MSLLLQNEDGSSELGLALKGWLSPKECRKDVAAEMVLKSIAGSCPCPHSTDELQIEEYNTEQYTKFVGSSGYLCLK